MSDDFTPGTVWLVGAGPGDPELLTRKAERLIRQASVVFHDALVGPGVLDLVQQGVRQVSVGKRSGRHSKDQRTIDELIVEAALAGERVLRLKGGDPAIFGRATEELTACHAAGVPVRICPGVTAASAAAADLGLSLTLRGLARRLTFVTAHTVKGEVVGLDWQALADPEATLAVYMGKAAAPQIAAGLIAAGLPADTPIALMENASLPTRRHFRTTLGLLPIAARSALGEGPAVILIGRALQDMSEQKVVKEAVCCEPVSDMNSSFNGEFSTSTAMAAAQKWLNRVRHAADARVQDLTERGTLCCSTGK